MMFSLQHLKITLSRVPALEAPQFCQQALRPPPQPSLPAQMVLDFIIMLVNLAHLGLIGMVALIYRYAHPRQQVLLFILLLLLFYHLIMLISIMLGFYIPGYESTSFSLTCTSSIHEGAAICNSRK